MISERGDIFKDDERVLHDVEVSYYSPSQQAGQFSHVDGKIHLPPNEELDVRVEYRAVLVTGASFTVHVRKCSQSIATFYGIMI
jgi:hypothetical protein